MPAKYYITTPIYYVNAPPHLGHAYTTIVADVLNRFHMLKGRETYFLTGTDEHGQKIQKAAQEAGMKPQVFCDKMVVQFKNLWKTLNISYDDFIRTTEERHITTVGRVLDILYKKGDVYKEKYEGWYCTPCETFWLEAQVIDQACPDCKRPLEKIAEENYFFRLSKYQDWEYQYFEYHHRAGIHGLRQIRYPDLYRRFHTGPQKGHSPVVWS